MVTLLPMDFDEFPGFFEQATLLFASENVAAGRWTEAGSIERSRVENSRLLPEGIATAGQFLFQVTVAGLPSPVGYLWLAEMPRGSNMFAFVCQIFINVEHRRKGYARSTLQAAEQFAINRGLSGIGLHVFAHNSGAQGLYRALGYHATSMNMFKSLGGSDA